MQAKAILAICIGYGAGIWFSISAIKRALLFNRALRWIPTRGRIIESTLCPHPNGSQATHFRVRYEFDVGGRIEGSTPRLAGDWFLSGKQQEAFVARFVPGEEVEVYYDPRDPRQNCLDRKDRSGISALWSVAAGGVILASLLVWLQFLRKH